METPQSICVLFLLKFLLVQGQKCSYNWKIYDGNTPSDAIEGGKDADGNTFYIGLVHLKLVNEILPGMIIPSKKSALITSFAIVLHVKNDATTEVKILCSTKKEAFHWIATDTQTSLVNCNLVPGGNVLGQSLYIGRARHNGGDVLGKIFPNGYIFQGLYIPSSGTHLQKLSFEVLAFNCNKTVENRGDMSTPDINRYNKTVENREDMSTSDINEIINDIFKGI